MEPFEKRVERSEIKISRQIIVVGSPEARRPKRRDAIIKKSIYSCGQFGHVYSRTFIVYARPFCVAKRVMAFRCTGTIIRTGPDATKVTPRAKNVIYLFSSIFI